MQRLEQLHGEVHLRVLDIVSSRPDWPCRKGCDECCRRLASVPRVSEPEWRALAVAVAALPAATADAVRRRIREGAAPAICPLLDREAGACLVYDARPVACRAYGFYAERDRVLGCERIAALEQASVIWGNHSALEERLSALGEPRTLSEWLASAPL